MITTQSKIEKETDMRYLRETRKFFAATSLWFISCVLMLGGLGFSFTGCTRNSFQDYNQGVDTGATAAVNALMIRCVKAQSLTLTLSDEDFQAIKADAIKAAQVAK